MNQDPIELWGGDNLYWFGPRLLKNQYFRQLRKRIEAVSYTHLENFSLSIKNEILDFFAPEENDIAYVYFYGGINDLAEIPIELFPLFIIKMKNISNWLELINKPNFYY